MTVTAEHLRRLIADELPELIAVRHDLHAHPELRYEENRTSKVVQRELKKAGVTHKAGLARGPEGGQDQPGTGVLGHLPGEGQKAVGLRADMDALPIQEANDLGYPLVPFEHGASYPGIGSERYRPWSPWQPPLADFRMGGTGLSGLALSQDRGGFPAPWDQRFIVAKVIFEIMKSVVLHAKIPKFSIVRYGSLADYLPDITPTAASGGKPAVQTSNSENPAPDVCFHPKQPFRSWKIREIEGLLSAKSSHSV